VFFASSSLKRHQVLLDRYSPTLYRHIMTKVGHLPPVKCAPSPAGCRSQIPLPGHLLKTHTKLPILAEYPYLTAISISVARCAKRIRA